MHTFFPMAFAIKTAPALTATCNTQLYLGCRFYNGKPIDKAHLAPGDIVFFKNTYRRGISHVGIYLRVQTIMTRLFLRVALVTVHNRCVCSFMEEHAPHPQTPQFIVSLTQKKLTYLVWPLTAV